MRTKNFDRLARDAWHGRRAQVEDGVARWFVEGEACEGRHDKHKEEQPREADAVVAVRRSHRLGAAAGKKNESTVWGTSPTHQPVNENER